MPAAGRIRAAAAADAPALARRPAAARAAALPGLAELHEAAAGWPADALMARSMVHAAMADGGRRAAPSGFGRDAVHGPVALHPGCGPGWRGIGTRLPAEAAASPGPCLPLICIARNTGARAFHGRHGFRAAATSGGAGTEEGEPDILYARDEGTLNTDTQTSGSTP